MSSQPFGPSEHAFDYRHDDFWCFALSNRMKSNAIFEVWNRDRDDLVEAIERELRRRVWAAGSVINGLRERLDGTGALFAWPPKFFLPAGFGFRDPLLSRLAFITRYEEVLQYLQVRGTRTRPADERFAVGDSFLLRAEGDDGFRLDDRHAEHDLEPDEFPELDPDARRRRRAGALVSPTTTSSTGRRCTHRRTARSRSARIRSVSEDGDVRLELTTRDAWVPPRLGQSCVLEPRYTDWLSHHVISELGALDDEGRLVVRDRSSPTRPERGRRDMRIECSATGRSPSRDAVRDDTEPARRVRRHARPRPPARVGSARHRQDPLSRARVALSRSRRTAKPRTAVASARHRVHVVRPCLGGGPADGAVQTADGVAPVAEFVEAHRQGAAHRVGGRLGPLVDDVRAAATPAPGLEQSTLDQPGKRGPNGHAPHAQRAGELAFDR